MLCEKCGTPIPEESAFCPNCGEKIEQPAPVEEPVETAVEEVAAVETAEPVAEEAAVTDEAAPAQAEEAPADVEIKPAKKKIKWYKPLLFVALPLILVAAVVLMNLSPIIGFAVKTFGSESDYLTYVEEKYLNEGTDEIIKFYNALLNEATTDVATESEMKITLSNDIKNFIKQNLGADFSWLDGMTLKMNANMKDDMQSVLAELLVSNEKLISLDAILDMEAGKYYLGIPELTSQYIGLKPSDLLDPVDASRFSNYMTNISELREKYKKALPSGETLDKLMDKYIKLALESIEDVEKSTDEIEVNGVEQELTVLEVEITEELLADMLVDILKEVKDDKEIEKIIVDFVENVEELKDEYDGDEVYNEFIDEIDDAIDSMEKANGDDILFTVYDYVNDNHEIVGRTLNAQGMEIISYALVRDGEEYAFDVKIPSNGFRLSGTGAEKNGVVNGKFDVVAENQTALKIDVKNVSLAKVNDGVASGTLTIKLGDGILNDMDPSVASVFSTFDPSVEIKFNTTKKASEVNISLLNGGKNLFGISITDKMVEPKAVTKPENVKDIKNESDLMEWANGFDTTKLMEKLEDIGVMDIIQQIIMSQNGSPDMDNAYGYDNDMAYNYDLGNVY